MIEKTKNRAMKSESGDVKNKEYMFPGEKPVTIKATDYKSALKKFNKLSIKK